MGDDKKGPCDCAKCRACCQRKPGIFRPGEATRAAAELGLSLPEFFRKYLTVDFWESSDDRGPVDYLSPAWSGKDDPDTARASAALAKFRASLGMPELDIFGSNAGRRCTFAEGFKLGPCALLGPTGCMLSFEARPSECRDSYGCTSREHRELVFHKAAIAEEWRGHDEEIAAALGEDAQ